LTQLNTLAILKPLANTPHQAKNKRESNPNQPTNRKEVQEPSQRPPTPTPKPQLQRKRTNRTQTQKRGTHCKKIGTPKNKRTSRSGGVAWRDTGAEVDCL
jgi:hypothetical protein